MNLMETAIKVCGPIIKIDEKGNQYVLEEDFQKLDANSHEKAFIKMCFAIENIEIKATPITKEDRPTKVGDYEYGNIEGNEIGNIDTPVMSELEYSKENLIFENYEELDKFLEYDFIPRYVAMKVNAGPIVNGKKVKNYPSIQLQYIVKLGLSEQETKHVLEYLEKNGIRVGGTSQDLDSEFENYDYVRTYATKQFAEPLTAQEEYNKFCQYYDTGNKMVLQELIERNLRLVSWAAYKLAMRHDVKQDELLSYGYEGLVEAIDRFNPYLGYKFSSYAVPCIEGYIKDGIPKEKGAADRNRYYAFEAAKYVVEKDWNQKFDGDEEMLEEILNLMSNYYRMSGKTREALKRQKNVQYNTYNENNDIVSQIDFESSIIDKIAIENFKEILKEILGRLTDREREVLLLRCGLKDGKTKTLEEVSKVFNVTRDRIRQIEARALRKLRHPNAAGRRLRDAIDAYENRYSTDLETDLQGEIFDYDNSYAISDEMLDYDNSYAISDEMLDLSFSVEEPEEIDEEEEVRHLA